MDDSPQVPPGELHVQPLAGIIFGVGVVVFALLDLLIDPNSHKYYPEWLGAILFGILVTVVGFLLRHIVMEREKKYRKKIGWV